MKRLTLRLPPAYKLEYLYVYTTILCPLKVFLLSIHIILIHRHLPMINYTNKKNHKCIIRGIDYWLTFSSISQMPSL